jgi:glyoxylase-like metal-dependent hydrolase (beta-lactamase superfamily II)
VADVRAVLLTHGHLDHTGLAHTLQEAGAVIWIHERDAAILYDGPRSATRHAKPERSMLPYLLRRPSSLALPFQLVRAGAFTAPAVQNARVFDADKVLEDVPGAPQAVVLPGHTPGSAAYLFADRGLLFTGDALVTEDGLSGHTGPTIVSRCFTHDSRAALTALDRLDELTADLLLPGHGAPFTDGIRTATRQARQLGVR